MPQDAFHIKRISAELNGALCGGKINRITQPSKDELTFYIYTKKTVLKLFFSTNASFARVCITQTEKEPLAVAPNFCMLLRKHLLGAEILSVSQHEFERIIRIDLHCTGDFSECDRTLYCEIMGKYSNITLVENGVILGALKPSTLDTLGGRPLFAGAKYVFPHPQEKASPFDIKEVARRLEGFYSLRESVDNEDLAAFLFENVAGLALPTARELAVRVPKDTPIAEYLAWACENLPTDACLAYRGGEVSDFFAFPVAGGKKMPSLVVCADEFYTAREGKRAFADKKRKLENAVRTLLKKIAKKKQDTLERLAEADKAEQMKIKGELLTANLYRLEKGMKEIALENWYEEGCPTVKIALDATLPPAKNAQRYFKAYAKAKRAKEVLTPILAQEEAEERYAQSVLTSVLLAETAVDLQEIEAELIGLGLLKAPKEKVGAKKKELVTPYREYEYEGFTVLSGRNNLQNDRLLKTAAPNDLWLHTQKYHSSHILIVAENRQVPDKVIKFAAEICAYYSEGQNGDKIPVDYCQRRFVKKPNKAKAGFVVYTDYKTALATPHSHTENLK
ncbi:MAG: NFACT family protein [Clostridia bacterium]|nr:NFACT family protein [Clostridia bacterium]